MHEHLYQREGGGGYDFVKNHVNMQSLHPHLRFCLTFRNNAPEVLCKLQKRAEVILNKHILNVFIYVSILKQLSWMPLADYFVYRVFFYCFFF